VWVFWPEDAGLVARIKRHSPNTVCLYDCVDYFTSGDPDLDKVIQNQEADLMRGCDYVFVNSRSLYQMKHNLRPDIQQVPLGFDDISFKRAERKTSPTIDRLFAHIPKPIIGYCGYLTFRLDYALLMKIILDAPDISFVFLGPIKIFPQELSEKETRRLIERLISLPNVYMIPPISSKEETARAVSHFDIGIIPYNISLAYNRYCYPMKLFEYFYLGKPVISTPIQELKKFPRYVKIGNTVNKWKSYINKILSIRWPKVWQQEERNIAKNNSWERKISAIIRTLSSDQIH
jgi:glycosyltransferase involved in cell wall biosynthesis